MKGSAFGKLALVLAIVLSLALGASGYGDGGARLGGSLKDLGTLGGEESWANGLNNAGQVVGWAKNAQNKMHAFLWTAGGGMKDLGTLGGAESSAEASSDAGQGGGSAA